MTWLLDTCVLIDILRGDQTAIKCVQEQERKPSVCAVSIMELYAGVESQRAEARIERLLSQFQWARLDVAIYRRAGTFLRHFRASHSLDIPDALIAATAEQHGLALATLNVKHFPMFPKLKPAY